MKKYFTKEVGIYFLKRFTYSFVLFTSSILIVYNFLLGHGTIGSSVLMGLFFALYDSITDTTDNLKIETTKLLTIENYWKLKKELNNKVSKKSKKKK